MSQTSPPAGASNNAAAPSQPSLKSAAVAPKINVQDVEMGRISGGGDGTTGGEAPVLPDVMQLARLGDVAAMQALFDEGEYDATFTDEEGITPLHVRPAPAPSPMCHHLPQIC